jgi:hypothetical protein
MAYQPKEEKESETQVQEAQNRSSVSAYRYDHGEQGQTISVYQAKDCRAETETTYDETSV